MPLQPSSGGRRAPAAGVATPTPVDCVRVEDVTTEHLGGVAGHASRFELAAFQTAVLELILDIQVPEWTAITVVWDGGDWREVVAERYWLPWSIAQAATAEERERGATERSTRGGSGDRVTRPDPPLPPLAHRQGILPARHGHPIPDRWRAS
jgi:hypothetical protein